MDRNYLVGCPKNGETHFWKTRLAEIGTVAQIIPRFGHKIVHFSAWSFWHIFNSIYNESIYHAVKCDPKKFRKLPSAVRFFPKVFRRSRFWTSIFVHFLKIFSSLVQSRIKNNKIYFMNCMYKYESIMVTQKSGWKNVSFWSKKKLKKRHQTYVSS